MTTAAQIARLARDWSEYAKEEIRVEEIGGTFYGFGSELATLRIFRKYGADAKGINQGYSANLGEWYFSLTPRF